MSECCKAGEQIIAGQVRLTAEIECISKPVGTGAKALVAAFDQQGPVTRLRRNRQPPLQMQRRTIVPQYSSFEPCIGAVNPAQEAMHKALGVHMG